MTDFLLELRSEEIPARMQARARDDLARLFAAELAKAGIVTGALVTYATPRRLALIARDLPLETAATSEEVKGPKTSAPPQALDGFLRKTGLTREQLTERDGVFFAVTERPGRATADVLAEAIPAIVRTFPWPKSMRWGDASLSTESLRWVRPLQGIVALLGEDVVPISIAGIVSRAATLGHRFHHPHQMTIGSAADYVEKLRMVHVIVDQDERAAIIRDGARAAAMQAGLELIEDEGLVAENAGLTEYPVPLLGRFDPAFLDVPPEVIQLTARVNQKYFVCRSADGKLANAFVCTANIAAADGGARIVEGNRKVLAARLADAKFFYDTDRKVPLAEQAEKLGKIVFHERLGTLADKVERVAKLARWLVEEGIVPSSPLPAGEGQGASAPRGEDRGERVDAALTLPLGSAERAPPSPDGRGGLAALAERAARLAKADLVTGMVGEFPELQGLMGGYYAAAQGEDARVAAAVRGHYKPVGQGDEVPTDPVTVAVALADKLDTIGQFFHEGFLPTGSKDPLALRRSILSSIHIIMRNKLRLNLQRAIIIAIVCRIIKEPSIQFAPSDVKEVLLSGGIRVNHAGFAEATKGLSPAEIEKFRIWFENSYFYVPASANRVFDFFVERLKVQQRELGVRHDLIDAVLALGGESDIVRLLARVHALQAFIGTEDGANLLAGYNRAANILKKEEYFPSPPVEGQFSLSYTPESDEHALIAALDSAEPRAAAAVAAEDFAGAMAALASLRAPIDAFFESVTVNDADPAKRAGRLALLDRVRRAVHGVADFSRIEG